MADANGLDITHDVNMKLRLYILVQVFTPRGKSETGLSGPPQGHFAIQRPENWLSGNFSGCDVL